jgi:hypothetical protein
MKKHLGLSLMILMAGIFLTSCTVNDKNTSTYSKTEETFESFHERFLSDEKFQLERVKFPVRGRYMDNDLAGTVDSDSMTWTKEKWITIRKVDDKDLKNFRISKDISENMAIVKTEGFEGGFLFIETYKKIDEKWYLISLTDISM